MMDPEIFAEYGLSMNRQHRFYMGSVIKKMFTFHVFASLAIINLIKDKIAPGERKYLIDGTFKIVPRQFSQLLIISIQYEDNVSYQTVAFLWKLVIGRNFYAEIVQSRLNYKK